MLDTIYIVLACLLGFLMTWGVGANDLANVMSTTMGSKAISVRTAMIIAVIFEFAGAYFGGGHVTETMRNGIIDISALADHQQILMDGMLAVLLAGTVWMNLASYLGLPVSITNAIVGSVIGFGAVVLGVHAIHWEQVTYIAISWISSPALAGVFAYLLFRSIQRLILVRKDPVKWAKRFMPFYLFLVGLILSFITIIKGLNHFDINLDLDQQFFVGSCSGIIVIILGMIVINRIPERVTHEKNSRRRSFVIVERMFAVLMALTACAMVFAHGSNDVAVAIGPISVVVSAIENGGALFHASKYAAWITLLGCTGVVTGLFMYGRKVIETVGSGITALTPSRAFCATIAAATAVVVSTSTGIPVSATQTLVGAVLGVGLARGIGALNLVVIRNIFTSWIITIPVASLLTIIFYHLIRAVLG